MDCKYNRAMLQRDYGMFCNSVDQCLNKLYTPDISESERNLLEKRIKVTFMMTDYSLSALEGFEDDFLEGARKGVDERRVKWGNYKTSTFGASPEKINDSYVKAWSEVEGSDDQSGESSDKPHRRSRCVIKIGKNALANSGEAEKKLRAWRQENSDVHGYPYGWWSCPRRFR
jgi:hypothetical protein